jgi:hypothetical protein
MRKEWTQEKPGWKNFPGEPTDGSSSKMDGDEGEKECWKAIQKGVTNCR